MGVRRLCLTTAAIAALTACSHIIAPPPPAGPAALMLDDATLGSPVAVAAKAARVLTRLNYTTRRFGADSTWGYQPTEDINVRLRYQRTADSTRVVAEYWGACERKDDVSCLRGEFVLLMQGLKADEAAPQE